jgi:hypothetical protein
LIAIATTDADPADDRSPTPQWNAARKDHHAPVIGSVDAKELLPGWLFWASWAVSISNARAENALLIEISMLPISG